MKYSRRFSPPTPDSLARAALQYLGRYAASEMSLRRVLQNRIRRAAMRDRAFAEDHDTQKWLSDVIEKIIEKHRKTGVLDDAAYAGMKVGSLRRAGRSARSIEQRLGRAGVRRDIIRDALTVSEEGGDPAEAEMKAARELARRRRLGSFRPGKPDPDRLRKDLAVLARAGFPLDVARKALGAQGAGEESEEAFDFSAK